MSERQDRTRGERRERRWSGFLWAVIGFGFGTVATAPLILAIEPRDRVIGGMMYGGIPMALVGLAYGLRRASRLSSPPSWRESTALIMTGLAWFLALVCAVYLAGFVAEPTPDRTIVAGIVLVSGIASPLLFFAARAP